MTTWSNKIDFDIAFLLHKDFPIENSYEVDNLDYDGDHNVIIPNQFLHRKRSLASLQSQLTNSGEARPSKKSKIDQLPLTSSPSVCTYQTYINNWYGAINSGNFDGFKVLVDSNIVENCPCKIIRPDGSTYTKFGRQLVFDLYKSRVESFPDVIHHVRNISAFAFGHYTTVVCKVKAFGTLHCAKAIEHFRGYHISFLLSHIDHCEKYKYLSHEDKADIACELNRDILLGLKYLSLVVKSVTKIHIDSISGKIIGFEENKKEMTVSLIDQEDAIGNNSIVAFD